jgi:co-chaperonin GroES (HSP10)
MRVLEPLGEQVVIKEPAVPKNAAGIELARSSKEQPSEGVVEAIGPDVKHLKVGDLVVLPRFNRNEYTLDGVDFIIMEEKTILTKIVEKK